MRVEKAILSNAFRYFGATAAAGSIRAAARELNVASSAVNRQILMLEEALGIKLFERTGRRLIITEPGRILLRTIDNTVADYEQAIRTIESLKGLETGRIQIACVESVSVSLLPTILSEFRERHPGIRAGVIVAGANAVSELVASRKADLGITFNPATLDGLEVALRRRVPVGAVVSSDHVLASRGSLRLADCFAFPIAYPAEGLSLRAVLDGAARRVGVPSDMALEANSLRLMASLARQGGYVAFQTRIGIEDDLARGALTFLPLVDELPADELMLVRQKTRAPSPAADAFFETAAAALQSSLQY